jgi:hypothetical protein
MKVCVAVCVGKDISDKVWNGSRASNAGAKDGVSTGVRILGNSTKELRGDLRTSLKQHGEILQDVTYADAVREEAQLQYS